jgi:hypothetical protein
LSFSAQGRNPISLDKIPYHQPHPPQKKDPYKTANNNLIKAFWVLSIDGLLWWQIEYKDTSSFLFKIYQKTNQRYFCKGRDKAAGSLNELPCYDFTSSFLHPLLSFSARGRNLLSIQYSPI